jgi:histidine triad (HIT) family protein
MEQGELSQEEIQKRMQMMKENCIFCKIAKKEIEGKIVFEDELCMAILDINPATTGHLLLFPKEHYMMLPMVPDEVLGHLSMISKYLSDLLMQSFTARDVSLFIANGVAAGQQSQHYMMHVIPRYEEDGVEFNLGKGSLSSQELESLTLKLREKLVAMNNASQ